MIIVAAETLLLAGWAVYRTHGKSTGEGADSLSGLIIATATLACVYHAMYDGLLLVLPWVGAACGRLHFELPPWSRSIVLLALTIPAINFLSTRTAIERLDLHGSLLSAVTAINGVAILAVFLIAAGVAVASPRTRPLQVVTSRQHAST
jgi:hypothetical protein